MRVVSVVGARPQFVKLAPVAHAMAVAGVEHVIIHTGQHYDPMLSDVFFTDLGIPAPDVHLGVGSGGHGAQTGAMLAALLIYILAWRDGIRPTRIILAGVAVSAFLGAGISAMMILYSDRVHSALMWMVGGLSARSWPHVDLLLPYTIVAGLLALMAAQRLNILQLGDDMARGIGLAVERTRILLTAVAALLAASAVSVVGLLGFVGLIVPHAARLMIGADYRFLLPAAALLGIAVVTLSDTAARLLFAPLELPVGIIMAVVGAPFFLYLLRRQL